MEEVISPAPSSPELRIRLLICHMQNHDKQRRYTKMERTEKSTPKTNKLFVWLPVRAER